MAKLLTRCPVCEAALAVTEVSCARCRTSVRSTFETCRFCRLAPEHLAFVEVFLRNEGNLSRVEKQLGLSYPTVRNRLSAALSALGFSRDTVEDVNGETTDAEEDRVEAEKLLRRRNVLEALAQGDIRAEEAAELLRDQI